jgi:hypothetical protein
MTRIPPAARQLIDQASEGGRKVTAKPVGDPDGFGVTRSVEFDASTSKRLVPILEMANDRRISTIDYEGKGRATITFVGDQRADFRDPYPIEAVEAVLNEPDDDGS